MKFRQIEFSRFFYAGKPRNMVPGTALVFFEGSTRYQMRKDPKIRPVQMHKNSENFSELFSSISCWTLNRY